MRRAPSELALIGVIGAVLSFVSLASGQEIVHQLEGRLLSKNGVVSAMRIKLVRRDSLEPVAETFSRTDGGFVFTRVTDGDYLIETFDTDVYEATSTAAELRPRPRRSIYLNVTVDIPLKGTPAEIAGVIAADVDLNVPKSALKHYRAGSKAVKEDKFEVAEKEFREAISIYQNYYQARLELGRELRLRKRFAECPSWCYPNHDSLTDRLLRPLIANFPFRFPRPQDLLLLLPGWQPASCGPKAEIQATA